MYSTVRKDNQIKRQYLPGLVADKLQQLILEDHYELEERLPSERELAKMMGVSRNVIREATKLLQERGLVDVRSGSGVYVTLREPGVVSRTMCLYVQREQVSIAQLYEVRWMLEIQNARMAALNATPEGLAQIRANLRNSESLIENPDLFTEQDVEFHRILAQVAGNPILSVFLGTLTDALQTQIRLTSRLPQAQENALSHHQRIFEAVESRDPDMAYHAMSTHLKNGWDWLLRAVENNDEEIGRIQFPA